MTSPFPNPSNVPSTANHRSSGSTSQKPLPQAWGLSQQSSIRRGLTPISTAFGSGLSSQPLSQSQSQSPSQPLPQRPTSSSQSPAPRNPWSPSSIAPTLNANNLSAAANSRQTIRSSSISSAGSPFSPPPGSQQQNQLSSGQLLTSGRSRTIASSTNPQLATAAAASQSTGGGASSGGGGGSSKTFRASPSLSSSTFGSPIIPSNSSAAATIAAAAVGKTGSLSQIVIAQLFLLLSTIKDDKDKAKWESEAKKIRDLVEAHGMEVFTKYFRRLIINNTPQIWGSNRIAESHGNYQILVSEVQKVTQDPFQAAKIVESIEGGEGEAFKDFDLSTFMEHFRMTPQGKILLAAAFKKSPKSDLRTKADAIMSNNLQNLLNVIGNLDPSQPRDPEEDLVFATVIDRLAQDPPRNWNNESRLALAKSFDKQFLAANLYTPTEISSTMALFDIVTPANHLVKLFQKSGSRSTDAIETIKITLDSADSKEISPQQVANALLFMVIARDEIPYEPANFVAALREHRLGQPLDWQSVVRAFDREGLKITQSQFKRLFSALLPLAHDDEKFDLQLLWGGDWRHEDTQLSFVSAFLSFGENELDAAQIPGLRNAYTLDDFANATDDVKATAEQAIHHPLVSLDATRALFNMVFQSSDSYAQAQSLGVIDDIINPKMDLFVGSVSAIPKPWGGLQDQAIRQLVSTLLFSATNARSFALHLLWKRDSAWLSGRLYQLYGINPMQLVPILEVANEQGWLGDLIAANNELSLDLAALAYGRNLFDFENWLHQLLQSMGRERVMPALCSFLQNKIDDDVFCQKEKSPAKTVPLTVRTAYTILTFLSDEGMAEVEQIKLQRSSISAYPRLVNYGTGHDELIDSNNEKNGNGLPPEADTKMQEHYKQMYGGEKEVREIIEVLQKYKDSQDPAEQDYFACMIFGIFDEYTCFGEYPMDALAITAVLFGSIINYDLLSKLAMQVAISMVLEGVRDFTPDDSMYKFGLQALVHFQGRLEEWNKLSETLIEIPGLQGTGVWPTLERVVRERQNGHELNQSDVGPRGAAADDFLDHESDVPEFTCLSADPPTRPDFYVEPDEQLQEAVLFILNNVSERNLEDKSGDLKTKIKEEHNQWLARYLVESRIKPQPNYHQLYMDLLNKIEDDDLWLEVHRETVVSCIRMLNAESTMNSSNERTYLKNFGSWLGSITLAQNKTIRYRNISFKDLLIEAHATNRLLVAIPFTCKVLSMAAHSSIFRPPCAWTIEILQILLELYNHFEMKLNLKFEIEVLCKTLGVNHKELEPSDLIRSRPLRQPEVMQMPIQDAVDAFSDMSLMNLTNRRGAAERFSLSSVLPQLSELPSLLKHNYSLPPTSMAIQNKTRAVLTNAVEQAIVEIVGPVVERSVTIAAIATSQLIAKDFATEPDPSKFREYAHTTVQSLAGSLAGVTCREPLKVSIQTHAKHLSKEFTDPPISQTTLNLFANDNVDALCDIVEKAAQSASATEIDVQIEDALQARQGQHFAEPQVSRWAYHIPDPFKPSQGGLNQEQLSIYDDFARGAGRPISHVNNMASETARQIPDVLQEPFPPVLSSATDMPVAADPSNRQMSDPPIMPSPNVPAQALVNGYMNGQSLSEPIEELVRLLIHAAEDAAKEGDGSLITESGAVRDAWTRIRERISAAEPGSQKDGIAGAAAQEVGRYLYSGPLKPQVIEFLTEIMKKFRDVSDNVAQRIYVWCSNDSAEDRIFNAPVTAQLIKSDLMSMQHLDFVISNALQRRHPRAFEFLRELISDILITEPPSALRTDLAKTVFVLTELLSTNDHSDPSLERALEIARLLNFFPEDSHSLVADDAPAGKALKLQYVFDEWLRIQSIDAPPQSIVIFAHQMLQKNILAQQDDAVQFFRGCFDMSLSRFEQSQASPNSTADEAYFSIDAFAKLLVVLIVHRKDVNGAEGKEKMRLLERTVSTLALILAQYYQKRGEMMSAKVFFRLFSDLISELYTSYSGSIEVFTESVKTIGRCLILLEPTKFPGFSFAWLSLISHRLLLPALLKGPYEDGRKIYSDLLALQLAHVGELSKATELDIAAKDYYRGTLKLLLVLHHDFPDFLAEYHVQILKGVPANCVQIRSLIVSAQPGSFPDFPDPFDDGSKAERFEDSRRPPVVRNEGDLPVRLQEILGALDEFLSGNGAQEDHVNKIVAAISEPSHIQSGIGYVPIPVDTTLLNDLVIHLVQHAQSMCHPRLLVYSSDSPHAKLIQILVDRLNAEARYQFISAMANQLRYPNSHTDFFKYALLDFWRNERNDPHILQIKQQILRVLLERIVGHRPHPWGLIDTTLELARNRHYGVWDAPFVKASPEVEQILTTLMRQMGPNATAVA